MMLLKFNQITNNFKGSSIQLINAFSALTLLVGQQERHP